MSKTEIESRGFSFGLSPELSQDDAILRLLELETRESIENPTHFSMTMNLSDALLVALCQTFQSFASRQPVIRWKSLKIFTWDAELFDPTHLEMVMRIANQASMFEKIYLHINWHELYHQVSYTLQILPDLEQNHRLKELELYSTLDFSPRDIQTLAHTLEKTSSLTELRVRFKNDEHLTFWEALALNMTLETIEIENIKRGWEVLEISQAVAGHPKLRKLEMHQISCLQSEFETAIQWLLTSGLSNLESISVSSYGCDRFRLNMEHMLEALKDNKTLKLFESNLELFGEKSFSMLLEAMRSHPTLESFGFNHSVPVDDIRAATELEKLPRRVTIGTPYIASEDVQKAVLNFLDMHPEVSLHSSEMLPVHIQYANHLNTCGRYLASLEDVPVGLWALVLEKIIKQRYTLDELFSEESVLLAAFKPSILFDFLRSPVLAGRKV